MMYGPISIDPVGEPAGTTLDGSASHPVSNAGVSQPVCAPAACDSLPRGTRAGAAQHSSTPSPFGTSLGPAAGPASIMAAFTAFVQQMFGQIASWMQRPPFAGSSAPPSQPRYLE